MPLPPGAKVPPEHDPDHQDCCIRHGLDPNWRLEQRDTVSWREGCDRALAGGSNDDDGEW